MKLRSKILLYFALITGITLLGVSFLGYYFAKNQVEANIDQEMDLAIEGV